MIVALGFCIIDEFCIIGGSGLMSYRFKFGWDVVDEKSVGRVDIVVRINARHIKVLFKIFFISFSSYRSLLCK
jgi:hypothetical protein